MESDDTLYSSHIPEIQSTRPSVMLVLVAVCHIPDIYGVHLVESRDPWFGLGWFGSESDPFGKWTPGGKLEINFQD